MQFDSSDIARVESKVDRTGVCHLWTAAKHKSGYGVIGLNGKQVLAHRLAFEIEHGQGSAEGHCVLHRCDVRACCNPAHLWLGTHADNTADMFAKGRNKHLTGAQHPARLHPERLARGDRNGSRTHPEKLPRGEQHPARLHPENVARGEVHYRAKLNETQVREIRALYANGEITMRALAKAFDTNSPTISKIITRRTWKHVV